MKLSHDIVETNTGWMVLLIILVISIGGSPKSFRSTFSARQLNQSRV